MIPRIIHRIWIDDPMPDEYERYGQRLRELHPDWNFLEWRHSTDLPLLINQHLFEFASTIVPHDWKRFQADVMRLELLWQFGGIYVDTDVEPLRPFDDLLDHEAFVGYSPNRGPKGQRLLTNAVMGAKPHNAFIGRCINALPDSVVEHRGKPLAQMAGPWHLTRMWENDSTGVTALHEDVFSPQSIRDRDRGEVPVITEQTLAFHKWANTRDKRKGGVR